MKKKITLIFVFMLICSFSIFAQSGWNQLTISETSTFKSIFFINQNCGFVAAANGAIYRTTDGGNTWTLKNSGIPGSINSIFLIDENNGWACGYPSNVYRTTDAGESWTQGICSELLIDFKSIFFTDLFTGFVVGQEGYLYKTTDGGLNWSNYNSQTTNTLSDIFFTNYNNGYAVGDFGTIVRTTDAGENWVLCADVPYGMFTDIWFADEYTGYAVSGGGGIIKTINGGDTWFELTISGSYSFHSVSFINANEGFVVGEFGTILKTIDGGLNWEVNYQNTVEYNHFYSVYFVNNNVGFVAGVNGTILKTTSAGLNPYLYLSSNNLTIEASENTSTEFDIDANTTWSVFEDAEWLWINPDNGANNSTINITATVNSSSSQRQAFITVFGGFVNNQTIVISQYGSTAITEISKNNEFCYPNPATDILNFKEIGNYQIYNSLGVMILNIQNVQNTDISNLNSGIYFVNSENGKIQKIIINN